MADDDIRSRMGERDDTQSSESSMNKAIVVHLLIVCVMTLAVGAVAFFARPVVGIITAVIVAGAYLR